MKKSGYLLPIKIVIIFFLLLNCHIAYDQGTNHSISLAGQHKFSPGDNPAYATPQYDDSDWQTINVPGSWQSQGGRAKNGLGWYRIYFTLPNHFKDIAVSLGRIGNADEVFLNGTKIGDQGVIGKRFVEATKVERLYKIPSGLLKFNDTNLLAIRVMNRYYQGGILDGIAIGEYSHLLNEKLRRDTQRKMVDIFWYTFILIYFMFWLFLHIKRIRDPEYISFGLFFFIYGTAYILDSFIFIEAGLKTPLIQQIIFALFVLVPANILLSLINLYQDRFNPFIKSILLSCLLFSLAVLFFGYKTAPFFLLTWKFLLILTVSTCLFLAIRAYIRKVHEANPLLIGCLGGGLIIAVELAGVSKHFYGLPLHNYGLFFFMLCVKYALITRYARVISGLKVLSRKILVTQEAERKRLSREIHDGLGQSLSAIKLNLQMMEAKAKEGVTIGKEVFPNLISEVSGSIEELREVAMDIRPSFLDEMGIADVIKWYGKKFQESSGIEVRVDARNSIKTGTKTKDNIYRIFQEAMGNIGKHSGASCVEVRLKGEGRMLVLEIKDNGKGFDYPAVVKARKGIGLSTMEERVKLLNGMFRIKSSDKGTSVYVEVPGE